MLQKVRELRDKTNVSLNACKKALEDSSGDIEKAMVLLQQRGIMKANEKSGRATEEGVVRSYIHANRIGVLVEVNCETDFAARSEPFVEFCDRISMQIAAMKPLYVKEETVPGKDLDTQREIFLAQVSDKPEAIRERAIQGKLKKWYDDVCLMNQESIVVEGKTIESLRADLVGKIGENVSVRRFVRWEVGM